MSFFRLLLRRLRAFFTPETVMHRGQVLPGKKLRFGGAYFLDDEAFLSAGEADTRRLGEWCGLKKESALLDVGCGTGRLALGILSTIGEMAMYRGIDVSETAVDWCRRFITPVHPTFQFVHINAENERYNPSGDRIVATTRLPFLDASFDCIHLYSVFSHMRSGDIRAYLKEFHRVLKPSGSVFFTAFIEENVPAEEENPANYQRIWKGALHCVRFSRAFFLQMLAEAGLTLEKETHGTETDGQSAWMVRGQK